MDTKAYILVVLGIFFAKALGFFRDIVFASSFGASAYTDMYFQIFGIVTLIFTGIGVALSTLVIKNINKITKNDFKAKKEYVSCFITKTSIVSLLVIMALYFFSGNIVRLLLPGLDSALYKTAARIMHIMLPSLLFVLIAYIVSGVLQNSGVFFITSIMSLPFNVAIILSLLFKNIDIITVSYVTTFGWFLHLLILVPSFLKKGYSFFSFKFKSKVNSGNAEILYIFISNMMFQLLFTIDKAFVSVESGAASAINYSSNLFITISSVFVVAMSNVVFPSISRNYEMKNTEYVKKLMQYIIKLMLSIFIPFILTVCFFGENIISVIYERGEFTHETAKTTSVLFSVYTFGFLGYICQELFNKILYLDSKYNFTVAGTLIIVCIKPIANILSFAFGGLYAVAASTSLLLILYSLGVGIALKKVVGKYLNRNLFKSILKIFLSCFLSVCVCFITKLFMPALFIGKYKFIIPLLICAFVYAVSLYFTGMVKELMNSGAKEEKQNE